MTGSQVRSQVQWQLHSHPDQPSNESENDGGAQAGHKSIGQASPVRFIALRSNGLVPSDRVQLVPDQNQKGVHKSDNHVFCAWSVEADPSRYWQDSSEWE